MTGYIKYNYNHLYIQVIINNENFEFTTIDPFQLPTIHIINNQYDLILGNYNNTVQQSMPTMQFTRQDHTEMRKRAVIKRRIPRNVEIGVASK